jgi:hypothetical protein
MFDCPKFQRLEVLIVRKYVYFTENENGMDFRWSTVKIVLNSFALHQRRLSLLKQKCL